MKTLTVSQAKAQLSAVLERVLAGEEIAIGRRGKPEILLSAIDVSSEPRPLGTYEGELWMSDDFDDPLPADFLITPSE